MTKHDYLVLAMSGLWLVTNFLGAGFAIARLRRHKKERAQGSLRIPAMW